MKKAKPEKKTWKSIRVIMGSWGEELLGHVGENEEEGARIYCSLQCEFNFKAGIDYELKVSVFSEY